MTRRCASCSAPRTGESCWKCGAPTFVPCAGWVEPALPPVDAIREAARSVGYAIGVHGSLERDLDLIAAPWSDAAVGNAELIEHLCSALSTHLGKVVRMLPGTLERKPLGRWACSLQVDGWFKVIDLSVMPRQREADAA